MDVILNLIQNIIIIILQTYGLVLLWFLDVMSLFGKSFKIQAIYVVSLYIYVKFMVILKQILSVLIPVYRYWGDRNCRNPVLVKRYSFPFAYGCTIVNDISSCLSKFFLIVFVCIYTVKLYPRHNLPYFYVKCIWGCYNVIIFKW